MRIGGKAEQFMAFAEEEGPEVCQYVEDRIVEWLPQMAAKLGLT